MALTALVQRAWGSAVARTATFLTLGVLGASLFYGDSVITPAISVLSAVEGVKVAAPSLGHLVLPVSLTLLTGLFLIQRWGTHRVGGLFGPVMVLWFTMIGLAGLHRVILDPSILEALSPGYTASFVVAHPYVTFIAMGAVVLTITGAEALYADMGHFGRGPDQPSLVLARLPDADAQLPRPGQPDPAQPRRDREPVLPADPTLGTHPDGGARDRRHDHRFAVGDLGRLLGLATGDAARVPAASDHSSHRPARVRPDLRSCDQLDALRRGRDRHGRVRLVGPPRDGVRRGRHRHVRDQHHSLSRRCECSLALGPVEARARRSRLPQRGGGVLRREHHEDRPRRLAPLADRVRGLHRDDHLAAWPRDRDREPNREGRPAPGLRRQAAPRTPAPGQGHCRLPASVERDNAASRYEPTSSTITSSTRTWSSSRPSPRTSLMSPAPTS